MAKSMCFDLRTVYVKKKSVPLQNYNVQSVTSIQHSTIYKLKVRRLSNVPWRILDRQPISGSPEFIVVRNLSLVWVEEARLVHHICIATPRRVQQRITASVRREKQSSFNTKSHITKIVTRNKCHISCELDNYDPRL